MKGDQPHTIRLGDYAPPPFRVERVDLTFHLDPRATRVQSRLELRRNAQGRGPLVLDGAELELLSLRLDGRLLEAGEYTCEAERLELADVPDRCVLEVETRICPEDNTSLEGLYLADDIFCTQCEAEGFRKITYFPDRPDVMARYTVTVHADKTACPVLLSNGNPVEQGETDDGRHWVRWEDPYPKPSYLFALVAGKLSHIEDEHVTASGRKVALRIYVEPENIHSCEHAMNSLKHAMRWDEEIFGLEYDLDIYMIVAVNAFNMGAMENKGLNVFNSKYVLARPETATDMDYEGIEGVIGHEYFHNWTGNRVTCRDWFQLSLKEGLTVFRDQEFSADMGSRPVKRIDDVRRLRAAQFPEDAGPMAHPVRPDSYVEINNFYTATVYEKGAEVVRMYHTLLGADGFRRGMDLYFERHDGHAVTTDDFCAAMADANGVDLTAFKRWYEQAGTPVVSGEARYDVAGGSFSLTLRQACPPTPGQPDKQPVVIPVRMGLLNDDGQPVPLQLEGEAEAVGEERVLRLEQAEQTFRFINVDGAVRPSLLRGFSAPVRLDFSYTDDDLAFLMAHDTDLFNRWEAGQQLGTRVLLALVQDHLAGRELALPEPLLRAFEHLLDGPVPDKALLAEALVLPGEGYIAEQMDVVDPDAIHAAREWVRTALASELRDRFLAHYHANDGHEPYAFTPEAVGRRRLKSVCLSYLMQLDDEAVRDLCLKQYRQADNMSDAIGALDLLASCDCAERTEALEGFYAKWRTDPLVVDKWLSIQARSPQPGTLETVQKLMSHPAFNIRNPNKVRALIGAFSHGNPLRFHDASGAGYRFLMERVLELDAINPMVAARLLGALSRWRRYDTGRQEKMKAALKEILSRKGLSKDCYEIASKSLGAA